MIDMNKCTNCLKCVTVCPANIYQEKNNKIYIDAEFLPFCTHCFHCAAVCPTKAITLNERESAILPISKTDIKNSIAKHILYRRAYRNFNNQPVDKQLIQKALSLTAWSASAKNEHPTRFTVINDKKKLKLITDKILDYVKETKVSPEISIMYQYGKDLVMANAQTLIIAYARDTFSHPAIDSVIALHDAELFFQSEGIGTCWAGYLINMCTSIPELKEILEIPKNHSVYGALMLGYPENESYLHIPQRTQKVQINWL